MSKVVILITPHWGHVMPTIALTRELVQRGEDVVYYVTPRFREILTQTGATIKLIPPAISDRLELFDSSKGFDLLCLWRFFLDLPQTAIDWFIDTLRCEEPSYVIHDYASVIGRIVSFVLGIPRIVFVSNLCYHELSIARQFPLLVLKSITSLQEIPRIRSILTKHKKRYKFPRHRGRRTFTDYGLLNIVSTSRLFQPWSVTFSEQFVFVGPMLSPGDQACPSDPSMEIKKPAVLISLGTLYHQNTDFYHSCIEAFMDSDINVILVVGRQLSSEAFDPLPDNISVFNWINQIEVLKHIDGFVTQGGMNSVCEALYCRVPMVVVPQSFDQYIIASRVHELGVGIHLKKPTSARLKQAVRRILADSLFREKASNWSTIMNKCGGATSAVDAMFEFKCRQGIR